VPALDPSQAGIVNSERTSSQRRWRQCFATHDSQHVTRLQPSL